MRMRQDALSLPRTVVSAPHQGQEKSCLMTIMVLGDASFLLTAPDPGLLGGAELFALFGVLVKPGLATFARDLDDDILVGDFGLAAEPRAHLDVERLVQDVILLLLLLGPGVVALGDVDVAGGAGAHAATRIADLCVTALGCFQDRCPRRYVDAVAVGHKGDLGHHPFPSIRFSTASMRCPDSARSR